MTSLGADALPAVAVMWGDPGVGGRMMNVCTGEATDVVAATAVLPPRRTGLTGTRALAVVVIPEVTGAFRCTTLAPDVGVDIQLTEAVETGRAAVKSVVGVAPALDTDDGDSKT